MLADLTLALAQLASSSQVEAARSRMVFWIIFTIAMFILLIYKVVKMGDKGGGGKSSTFRNCRGCGKAARTTDTSCEHCGSTDIN